MATRCGGRCRTALAAADCPAKHPREQVDASLRRLDTDYIDVYCIHRFVDQVPVEEMMEHFEPSGSACRDLTSPCRCPLMFVMYTKAAVNGQTPGKAVFTFTCETPVISAFEAPVDAAPVVNLAQAGRTIPFKFTVTDNLGTPVTDLTTDDVTPVTDLSAEACGTTANVSAIEAYSSSGAGTLTHLGNGHYLYTLQTDKTWRGTCGTVGVNVRGVEQTADFQFRS